MRNLKKQQGLLYNGENIFTFLTYASPSTLLQLIEGELPLWVLHLRWCPVVIRPFTRVSNVWQDHLLMSQQYFQLSINLLHDHNKPISCLKKYSMSTFLFINQSVNNFKDERNKGKKFYLNTILIALKVKYFF